MRLNRVFHIITLEKIICIYPSTKSPYTYIHTFGDLRKILWSLVWSFIPLFCGSFFFQSVKLYLICDLPKNQVVTGIHIHKTFCSFQNSENQSLGSFAEVDRKSRNPWVPWSFWEKKHENETFIPLQFSNLPW